MNEQPQIGAVFPQTELGGDPGAVRAWVQAVTELGYRHIAVFDHVVGADPEVHTGWNRPYTVETTFHEILVLFGFVAALTPLELVSSVVILPQRQTVLVAKQAAEIDLLTDGRFRLGVRPGPKLEHAIAVVHGAAVEAGRDPAAIGMEGRVQVADAGTDAVADAVHAWRDAGASHVAIGTMGAGLATVEDHVGALGTVAEHLALERHDL